MYNLSSGLLASFFQPLRDGDSAGSPMAKAAFGGRFGLHIPF